MDGIKIILVVLFSCAIFCVILIRRRKKGKQGKQILSLMTALCATAGFFIALLQGATLQQLLLAYLVLLGFTLPAIR